MNRNRMIRASLTSLAQPRRGARYGLEPASMGDATNRVDLVEALTLADHLEDQDLIRKLEQRK
ncbi:MAG: hypothetical protein MPN21_04460 [Thermoanaerobaculia bacterium]|nr:hypothetical protein [Thermoanaerobaculia bacterium]